MQIRTNRYGRVEALCGFTTTAHGGSTKTGASDLRMPWIVANKPGPGAEEVST